MTCPNLAMIALAAVAAASSAAADPAVIEAVEGQKGANGWTFAVTLRHGDTGWDDYADGWRVLAPDGTVLGTRVLTHPHVAEQPFTRSLSGVEIPAGLREIRIEARTGPEGWSGPTVAYSLPE